MAEVQDQQGGPFAGFDPSIREDVEGLAQLGHLQDDFEFAGHHFTIRTLKADEELAATLVCKPYIDSFGQARAWAWARVGLALVSVDNDPNFCPPIGPDKEAFARARFNWVTSRWYWPLGEYLFNRYVALEGRQIEAIRAVANLSDRGLQNSTPSVNSLTEPGDSEPPQTEMT